VPLLGEDPRIAALTTADVAAVARKFMAPDAMSVLTILPGQPGGYPDVLTASSGTGEPIVAPARPHVDVPALPMGKPGTGTLPPMETATLSNGIRVVHYLTPSAPQAYVAVSVPGGSMSDPAGKEGLFSLTTTLMTRGAGERNFAAFSKATKDIGANVSAVPGNQQTSIGLSVLPEEFAKGIDLLADAVLRPRFEAAEWEPLKAETLQGVTAQRQQPAGRAYLALTDMLFPTQPGLSAFNITPAAVLGLTLEDVRGLYGQLFTPKGATIYSVGPVDLAVVTAELERAFGTWQSDSPGMSSLPHPPAQFAPGRKIWIAPAKGDTSQSTIFLARPAPALNDDGKLLPAMAVASLLGGSEDSRLNRVLRKAKGYSYGVNAGIWTDIPSGGLLMVTAPVQADKVGASLAEIFAAFDRLATEPVTDLELIRSTMSAASTQAGLAETAGGLLGLVLTAADVDMTAEDFNSWIGGLATQTLPAVQKEATDLAALDSAVIVISGDPAVVLPQLAEIGITDAEVLTLED
jgi:predicted Zn-dependent peptidase